jgi:L-threonylcarbamoyladenylate synthase
MDVFRDKNHPQVRQILLDGGIGILRTDTLYGVVAKADNKEAVERVYQLKSRDESKSPIVLISSFEQTMDKIDDALFARLGNVWPGPISVILPSSHAPSWIRRDNNSVAYRMPADEGLGMLIDATGPLIAPSANPEGQSPAMNIKEAQDYFGDTVDFYIDEGEVLDPTPSQLLRINSHGEVERLR